MARERLKLSDTLLLTAFERNTKSVLPAIDGRFHIDLARLLVVVVLMTNVSLAEQPPTEHWPLARTISAAEAHQAAAADDKFVYAITNSFVALAHGFRTIQKACEEDPITARMVHAVTSPTPLIAIRRSTIASPRIASRRYASRRSRCLR